MQQNGEDLQEQVEDLKRSNRELLAKEKDIRKTIEILQERNQQLCKSLVVLQTQYHPSPLPGEEWYYIHAILEQTLQWFQQIIEDAESLDIKLPKK